MTISEILNHDLPILKPTDSVGVALTWMEENRISQLVVSDESYYSGIVSEDLLLNYDEETEIADVMKEYSEIYLSEYQHIYEALSLISKFHLKIVGVVDKNQNL